MLTLRDLLDLLDGDGIVVTEDWETIKSKLPEGVNLDRVLLVAEEQVPEKVFEAAMYAFEAQRQVNDSDPKKMAEAAVTAALDAERDLTLPPQET